MHVNLGGYINMMRAVLPYLKETRGSITCISSVHGKRPTDFDPVYAMTKGGMHMLLREAAIEFAKYGVRVNMIMPAGVKIEFKTGNPRPFQKPRLTPPREYYEKYPMYPLGRHGLPEDSGWACVVPRLPGGGAHLRRLPARGRLLHAAVKKQHIKKGISPQAGNSLFA